MKYLPKRESGQALLLVLLSMSVVLTIVLSILARSTVDIGISTRSEESVRAFSAAEAGIERALVAGVPTLSGNFDNGSTTFDAKVTSFSSAVSEFILPSSLYSGESATVWFVSHKEDGSLSLVCDAGNPCFTGNQIEVCWGKEETRSAYIPAIEISVIYLSTPGDYTTAKIARVAVDPNDTRRNSNSFSDHDNGTCVIGGQTFVFRSKFNLGPLGVNTSGLQLARIAILYNTDMGHPVAVRVFGGILPAQGVVIDSSGVSGNSTRKVEVIRGFKELPGIFENVAFSYGGITQ
ncbi:MAG: hypothetical protein NTV24_05445 [Candidatus Woesebacteria bacterium]|nr:hypothetical protein [Candidatus Woesebacteria bacterium]